MDTQVHIFFTGEVQGVGFRATTRRLAEEQGLRGWVRNLPDGRVELRASGPENHIRALLEALRSIFRIRQETSTDTKAVFTENEFRIRYDLD